jgi:hypothetical protein
VNPFTVLVPSTPIFASGVHPPLWIALVIIVAVVLLKVVVARSRGRSALGGKVVVRCSQGHLFTTTWSSLGSFTSVRLGAARFQRCPVGKHWSLVKSVNDSELTDEERRMIEQGHDIPSP